MLKAHINTDLTKKTTAIDVQAFEEIYQKYASRMLTYALQILKEKEVCEDIIQNIFIDFWSKRETNTVENLEGYLFRAVKFQIFKYFRDSKFSDEDLTRLNLVEVSVSASKILEYQDLELAINKSVDQLPSRCKEIFQLSRFEHKTNQEIADLLGVSLQAVKNQISKALAAIRTDLKKEEHILLFLLFFSQYL
ncbi:RNA polymerase sigma-70 factor [Flavobacterium ardleyense]|uniref:RNA polymerase sigma-70 factor n=1 Tax=Flavobacterium ardleyense TaxID=2038737 RepID=A0ABW5Z4W2_9FLAO